MKLSEKLNIFDSSRIQKNLNKTRKQINQIKREQINNLTSRLFKHINDSRFVFVNLSSCYLFLRTISFLNDNQFDFDIQIFTFNEYQKKILFIDTSVSISNFVNFKFVKQHKLFIMFLKISIKFIFVDDNRVYRFIQMIQIKFKFENHTNEI